MTNQVTFTMPARQLKALAISASKDDVRYYLKGIAFDFTGTHPVAVSTDGHRLLAIKIDIPVEQTPTRDMKKSYIVPLDAIQSLKTKKFDEITITIRDDETYSLSNNGTETSGRLIEGRFPDWRKVTPTEVSGEPGQYQADYIGDFGKISTLLDAKYPTISHNGDKGPALINLTDDSFGVLMPFRAENTPTETPNWV